MVEVSLKKRCLDSFPMISASILAILTLSGIILLLFLLFRFFIFKKISVTYGEFNSSRAVYRIVKGDFQTLEKEQTIFTRRAQSLWGKEMRSWPTFRITFPNFLNKYSIFGIIVPDSFTCDKECLEELGFKLGSLDFLPYVARIEMPTRFCYSLKLNQYRALRTFKSLLKRKLCKKSNNHNKIIENNAENKQNDDIETNCKECDRPDNHFDNNSDETKNQIISDLNEHNNSEIKKEADENHDYITKSSDEANNNDINNQINEVSNDKDSNTRNNDDDSINDHDEIQDKNNSHESKEKSEDKLINKDEKELNRINFEEKIDSLTDSPPFAEIRYRKKKKQIFITPLMNYNELIGLWLPDNQI